MRGPRGALDEAPSAKREWSVGLAPSTAVRTRLYSAKRQSLRSLSFFSICPSHLFPIANQQASRRRSFGCVHFRTVCSRIDGKSKEKNKKQLKKKKKGKKESLNGKKCRVKVRKCFHRKPIVADRSVFTYGAHNPSRPD